MMLLKKTVSLMMGILMLHSPAWAQGALRDPTTPPPGAPRPLPLGATAGAEAPSGAAAPQPLIRMTPVAGAGKQAVIGGQSLEPGGKAGPSRQLSITAQGVVLKDSRGTRTVPASPSSVRKSNLSGATSEQ